MYFNHSYHHTIVGTADTQVSSGGTRVGTTHGFITDAGVSTVNFNDTAAPEIKPCEII